MTWVKTNIDGQQVEVARDRWALDVARELGIAIPTLCHHPAVEPYGACRLCVVEVTQGRWTWLTTACDLPIRDGLSIRTDTEPVIRARRMALELLWAEAPDAVAIQDLGRQLGLDKPRFAPRETGNKCILCGLCVRVCRDAIGQSAIGFSRRATERRVGSPLEVASESCIGCGACVAVCPTGHVEAHVEGSVLKMDTWQTDLELMSCLRCGRPFAPKRLVEHTLAKSPPELADAVQKCPACRTWTAATQWSQATRHEAGLAGTGR